MDRRRHTRHERHFPLRFGDGDAAHEALTRDLSAGGLFVATTEIYPPGARLWLELVIEPQRPLRFEVMVVRQLQGMPGHRRESGFGVRFLSPAEVFARYLPAKPSQPVPLSLAFPTAEALELAARRGLSDGYAFVWSEQERAVGERVALTLRLGFADRTLEVGARVTQVVSDGGRFGLALALDDTTGVTALLGEPSRSES